MNLHQQAEALSQAFRSLLERVARLEATAADLAPRIQTLEAESAALRPLLDPDRLEVARCCERLEMHPQALASRGPCVARSQAARAVFAELRGRGWSCDRIARASGYSARAVQMSLARAAAS